MARYDDLNTKMIAYATVLSIVVLVLILQGLQALTYSMVNSEDERKLSSKEDSAAIVKSEQIKTLDGYREVVVPEESGGTKKIFQIPISEAKKLVLKDLGK